MLRDGGGDLPNCSKGQSGLETPTRSGCVSPEDASAKHLPVVLPDSIVKAMMLSPCMHMQLQSEQQDLRAAVINVTLQGCGSGLSRPF